MFNRHGSISVICRCRQCALFLCEEHDVMLHTFNACHDRFIFFHGYYENMPCDMILQSQEEGCYTVTQRGINRCTLIVTVLATTL